MILTIITHSVAFISGGLFSYFFLKANPQKAVALGNAVEAVTETASAVGAVAKAVEKKL